MVFYTNMSHYATNSKVSTLSSAEAYVKKALKNFIIELEYIVYCK